MLSNRICGVALLAAASIGQMSAAKARDVLPGEKVFKTQCSVCHQVVTGKKGIGPNLFGVVGRPAGSVAEFKYTEANKNSGITWDAPTLDRYLLAPKQVVPGTSMPYPGLKDNTQRTDLIAYLSILK